MKEPPDLVLSADRNTGPVVANLELVCVPEVARAHTHARNAVSIDVCVALDAPTNAARIAAKK